MNGAKTTRVISVLLVLSLLAPSFPSSPAAGGSAWHAAVADLHNGTANGTAWTPAGIRLPVNETYINNWTRVDPWPEGRSSPAVVYDDRDDVFVLFGGNGFESRRALNDTWIYDPKTNTWTERHPALSPPAGDGAGRGIAYDSANGVVVMFGQDIYTYATWIYNVTTNEWTDMYPWPTPRGRIGYSLAYDKANGVMVLFGGWVGGEVNDTWTYNVSNNSWTEMMPITAPPCCPNYAMAYDEANGVTVLFGGTLYGYEARNDTWTYNYTANNWTRKSNLSAPPPRMHCGLAYDSALGRSVLFGGTHYNSTAYVAYNDTWTYDAGSDTWEQLATFGEEPLPVYLHAMGYDPVQDKVVVFDGMDAWGQGDQTYSLDLTTKKWTRATSAPMARYVAAMASASKEGAAVLFGGYDMAGMLNDTWTYDFGAARWKNMRPAKSPHSDNYNYPMAYDSAAGLMIMYTGQPYVSTWVYNISANTWTDRHPAPVPGPRCSHYFAYDEANGFTVLSCGGGGAPYTDTWVYYSSNNTWVDRNTATYPPIRSGAQMVYDSQNKVMVVFGGMGQYSVVLNDTWIYNGTNNTWFEVTPPSSPEPMSGYQMVYDEATGEVILFGGVSASNTVLNDTWTYNTSENRWTRIYPVADIRARCTAGMACDGQNGTVIIFGGYDGRPCTDTTYAFNLRRYISPGCYTSQPFDAGGEAYFGNVTWKADLPANTSVRLQLRTGATSDGLNSSRFVGPDGTNESYYEMGGEAIHPAHNGSRWIQYRAYLNSSNLACTPVLRNVTLRYNLLHSVAITSPAGGESWNGTQIIAWNASDSDGDRLFIDIHLINGTNDTPLASGIPAVNRSWPWDTSSTPNGTYTIRLVARDDNLTIPLSVNCTSPEFMVFHPHINEAPSVALLSPQNDAVLNTPVVNLTWTGTDPEGDTLRHHVFLLNASFDAGSLPPEELNTSDMFYEKSGLENGTYYWTVVASDGNLSGAVSEIRRFSVAIPEPHLPVVALIRPADNATVDNASVELVWNASDRNNDSLTFLLAYCAGPFASGTPIFVPTNQTSHALTDLSDNTTYYWLVTASDGTGNSSSETRRFTVSLPIPNRPPHITSSPDPNATVNSTYYYNITATDPDNDTLTYELDTFPSAMELNRTTGRLQWRPTQNGTFNVVVRVSDGKGGSDGQTFNVTVKDAPVVRPHCQISTSVSGPVSKRFTIEGTVAAGSRPVVSVQVSIDGGTWSDATGTTSWSFTIDTTKLKNGMHTIKVRAFDGTSYSDEASVEFEVRNAALPVEGGFPWWILAVAVLIAAVGGAAVLLTRKKGVTAPEEEAEQRPAEEKEEKEPVVEIEKEPLPPKAEEIAIRPEAAPEPVPAEAGAKTGKVEAAVAVAAPAMTAPAISEQMRAPAAPPAPALKEAPEGFAVEDIFLMYEDGRLIQHSTRRIKADMDADIMASMLTAVKDFIRESVGMADGTELGAMEYGDNKILLQKGKYIVLTAVITGAEPADFRDEMRHTVSNIEGEFGPVLASWDGITARLAGAKKFLGQLGAYKAHMEAAAPEKAKSDISLKGELEFYQGFVRLKVAVRNGGENLIVDVVFKLVYKDAVLRLDHVEPAYPAKGDDLLLGYIEPKEKKTIAFYLDPQICTESYLEGLLSYKDSRGQLNTMTMPRKLASVVCPIVYTDENINTAMLKRMAAEELDKKDTKVFAIPPALAPEMAFDLAEAAVQHHDVRLVREFTEETPFVGEAWYYGKAKGRDDRLVIRARVLGDKNVLEFFVASSSTLMLTGMLAELKADLNKELEAQKDRPQMKQVTAPDQVDAVAKVKTLLDRAAELEQAAGETEVRR